MIDQRERFEQIQRLYNERYENPNVFPELEVEPSGILVKIDILNNQISGFDAMSEMLTLLDEIDEIDRAKLVLGIRRYIAEIQVELDRMRSLWKAKTTGSMRVTARDWLATHCPVFESNLLRLIDARYVSDIEPKIKWLKSQSLLAGLLLATVNTHYFDEIRDVDDFIDYRGNSLASQFRQKTKPRGWESLKSIIPSLELDDSEPLLD